MAKDPAFLFYPGDFNTGTQFFTDEQVGKYMRLLMAQHQHGHLTENQVIIICKSYDKEVMSKFCKDSSGLWYNERLENEIIRRKNFTSSRSKNREGKTRDKNTSNSYDIHMETKNETILINKKSEVKNSIFGDEVFITEVKRMHVGKDLNAAFDQCWLYFSQLPNMPQDWEWRQKFTSWLIRFKPEENGELKRYKTQ